MKEKLQSGDSAPDSGSNTGVRLRACDISQCEATCCYDGVYLADGEEDRIKAVVASDPEFFSQLPPEFIVDGDWASGPVGRKTATRPHDYQRPDYPAHFARTRCVFCTDDHRCTLQMLAMERGLHRWTYKPDSCWKFPLRIIANKPAPPPARDEKDPNDIGPGYPGFAHFTPCGMDRVDGKKWDVVLGEEIDYFSGSSGKPDDKP